MSQRIEHAFPNLAAAGYSITSPATDDYNCVAWAAGDTDIWWWPDPMEEDYWPADAPREETVAAFLSAFEAIGFSTCESAELESGFERIAVFADANGIPTHAARQLPFGDWDQQP